MSHPKLLDPTNSALVVVDVQEAFRNVIPDFEEIAPRIATAVNGFSLLGVPILVTEQYPKGLGHTAAEIALSLPDGCEVYEKTAFSSCGSVEFAKKLDELDVHQVVLCGIETHICVNQTAHELLEAGFEAHLLTDCISSRFHTDREAGLTKMYASGAVASSVEMALFELMRDAKHEKFKEIQSLIK
jgi:nicotinamidase-related amidase